MDIATWIASGILAAMLLMAFTQKAFKKKEDLAASLPWTEDFSTPTVRFIGISEGLIAVGLILPWLTGIMKVLTPIAAASFVLIMILAMVVHVRRGEKQALGFNAVLMAIAAFIAISRFMAL